MMLFYIIPFEKRFCSYLKLLRRDGCGGAGTHTRANKHALGCLALPSLLSVCSALLTWKDAYWMLQSRPTERCFFNAQASSKFSAENFTLAEFEFVAETVGFWVFVDTLWSSFKQK